MPDKSLPLMDAGAVSHSDVRAAYGTGMARSGPPLVSNFVARAMPAAPAAHAHAAATQMPQIRVMHVVLTLDPGGTERLVIEIARTLNSVVQSVVCCLDRSGAWAPELASLDVPVIALDRQPGFRPSLGRRVAKVASEYSIDVLHCHHYSPFVYGQIAAFAGRYRPVVFTEHGRLADAEPSRKRRLINRVIGRLPAAAFAVSHDLKRHMLLEGWPKHRLDVVHNGIDPGHLPTDADRQRARAELKLLPQHLVVGTIGRLDPVKDLTTLVDAFARTQREQALARLVICGDGTERLSLEERVTALGLRDFVTFAGYRRDARALLPGFDVFANSSVHEGVSLTILEAMAAGLPIVATRVGGTPEVVVDDEMGALVPAHSPSALAAAIDKLLLSPALRATMGEAARARVVSDFSLDVMSRRYLSAYRAALGR